MKTDVKQQNDFLEMLASSQGIIFKVCLFYTDRRPENVKDLYQEIVAALWESWPSFQHRSAATTWVYSVALRTAVGQHRRRRLPPFVRLDEKLYSDLAESVNDELVDRLYELIDRLDDEEKETVLLYLDRVPRDEMARRLGISENSVSRRLNKIKAKLTKMNKNEKE